MFTESAGLYDLIYDEFKDYAAEAEQIASVVAAWHPSARRILDVGCGTGQHALHLTGRGYRVDGVDLEPEFVAMAARRCPAGRFVLADMTDFDLGERYDVVLSLFSAIGYVRTPDRLGAAARCLARHLETGGIAVVEPWFTPDAFRAGAVHLTTVERDGLKIARVSHAEVTGRVSVLDFQYLVARPEGVEHIRERHELGLFTREEMRAAFVDAGLDILADDGTGPAGRGLYVARRT